MRIHVRYFAALREKVGKDAEDLDVSAGATVDQARAALIERYPQLASTLVGCAAAVNRAYASAELALSEGDELVFIPPLGGG
ncbi:MAG TPA: molybdopterin converting factor subunit 1 [Ktedonobacterales bacterium]|jgi:molybdopterin converting factor subunit 1